MTFLLLAMTAGTAFAGNDADEKLLGLTEQALKDALPSVVKLAKPIWGPHRERGAYVLKNSVFYDQNFDAIFYFKNGRTERIEQRQVASMSNCDSRYASLNAKLDTVYGVPISESNYGDIHQSTAWQTETFKVLFHKIQDESRCELLVAFMPLSPKDSSEL